MKKSTQSLPKVVDAAVLESSLRKAKLAAKREQESSKKKKMTPIFKASSDDDSSDGGCGLFSDESDDDRPIRHELEDDLDGLFDDYPQSSSKPVASSSSAPTVTISPNELAVHMKRQRLRMEKEHIDGVITVMEDIDPNDDITSELPIENNSESIRRLFTIHQNRPSRSSARSSSSSNNVFYQDYQKQYEQGLQSVSDTVKMPTPSVNKHAQSEMTITQVAEIIVDADDQSIQKVGSRLVDKLPYIEFRSREREETYMRECFEGERPCINGEKCEGKFVGETKRIAGFTLVSFETTEAITFFNMNKKWPDDIPPRQCVLCERKAMNKVFYDYYAGNSERNSEHPTRYMGQITYHNKVGDGEYPLTAVVTTAPNSYNGLLYAVVMDSRIVYRIVIRDYMGRKVRFYQQDIPLPTSFRVGRTQQW